MVAEAGSASSASSLALVGSREASATAGSSITVTSSIMQPQCHRQVGLSRQQVLSDALRDFGATDQEEDVDDRTYVRHNVGRLVRMPVAHTGTSPSGIR